MSKKEIVVVDGGQISLERIAAVAKGDAGVMVGRDAEFVKRMERTQELVMAAVQNGVPLYGVNTGFGKSCSKRVPVRTTSRKVVSPIAFHGCGTGEPL
ncbi:MAG: aromatic amino acid ammonia-lyase, partial [Syntrophales bacterium]|nr:aromatic amino acid ammonia-lyase [Syntrophales bacterium]